jgi:hypothetical protein
MDPLRNLIAYWQDCIRSESALEQSFGIAESKFGLNARTRAHIFEGPKDPFIFAIGNSKHIIEPGKMYDMIAKAKLKGQEIYFGYPLLMYFDRVTKKNRVAPLLVIRLDADLREHKLILTRAETSPALGNSAFEKLGLKQEEIVSLNSEVAELFDVHTGNSKLEAILYLLKKETRLTFVEGISPDNLSANTTIHPYDGTVVYNKAVIYVSEASSYNLHLLNDLERLVQRDDLHDSSLRYIDSPAVHVNSHITPILPFPFDEYQLRAIEHIMGSSHTVVTGPPGTGKSQFIANLIVNLFLQKKRVLFVSHTSEAVRVVNERINNSFANLMMQTGKKEVRQDLGRRLADMVAQYNGQLAGETTATSLEDISKNWKEIGSEANYVKRTDMLLKRFKDRLHMQLVLHRKSDLRSQLKAFMMNLLVSMLAKMLVRRRSNYEVLYHIEELKARHVDISRSYVKTEYLGLILKNDLYGQLVAYIEAVQNKKFTHASIEDRSEKYIQAALGAMSIWSCTLKSLAANFPLSPGLFDYVIFDEASQIDLPSAAPALYRAKKAVVVGDENQLSHIVTLPIY